MGLHRMKRGLIACLLVFLFGAPFTLAQTTPQQPTPPIRVNNLFSIWVKLSLIGYSQSEIESSLQNVDPELLKRVKHRMRLNVIKNLNRMNLKHAINNSTTAHDLRVVTDKIKMEVRFAGLENDPHIRVLIRNHFGIPLSQI